PILVMAVLTFYLAVSSRRHVPVFLVLTLPFAALVIASIRVRVVGLARTSLVVVAMIAVFGTAVFFRWPAYQALWRDPAQAYCTWGNYCFPGLVRLLIKHPPQERGFNFYDWGGYLVASGVPAQLLV